MFTYMYCTLSQTIPSCRRFSLPQRKPRTSLSYLRRHLGVQIAWPWTHYNYSHAHTVILCVENMIQVVYWIPNPGIIVKQLINQTMHSSSEWWRERACLLSIDIPTGKVGSLSLSLVFILFHPVN